MRILAFLVLFSALAIAGCAAFFSVIGLKLLFVGGGVSIIVMGVALEVGKLITATFLKQKWDELGIMLRIYLILATLVLVGITSVGIYGYLSSGYNSTSVAVQGYERTIDTNISNIKELEVEISNMKSDKYNESETVFINENRKSFIEQRLQLVSQKNQQIEKIRLSASDDRSGAADITAAKQALELSKQALDSDTTKELEQIKLYNSRLEILDREVQKWIDEGRGNIFRKSGLDRARETKESQKSERDDIDSQIKRIQDRIEKLRIVYEYQVKEYNERVLVIEERGKSQRTSIDDSIKTIQQEISDIMNSINNYNKETDNKISELGKLKEELTDNNRRNIEEYQSTIKNLHTENDALREKIVRSDVGTFKFIAKSLNIELDSAVNYFIWTIMFVFDPLAVCLILAYNSMLKDKNPKKEKTQTPETREITPTPVTEAAPIVAKLPLVESINKTQVESTPVVAVPVVEEPAGEIKFVTPKLPPAPIVPHGISSGKNHPQYNT
jgi:hypothetical protein